MSQMMRSILLVWTEGKGISFYVLRRSKLSRNLLCSLIQFYPNFETHLRESLRAIVGNEAERKVEIGMAKDGSGVGGKHLLSE